jgi:4-hydroxy 2-oxovalerate aldolase
MTERILICDPSLRDGNHAVAHQLSHEQVRAYCLAADRAGIPIVEVGHGNGLGASSLQVGLAKTADAVMLKTAREALRNSKLGIHVIPGFATIERDLKPAIDYGVDVFRIAAHCTEADITERHIRFCRNQGKTVFGVLMMSHMADVPTLCDEARKMEGYGAEAIIIMDSSGTYLPEDVSERIAALRAGLSIPVGFHGHNNLGMAVANSVAAVRAGASILDACARGFGAGAGNTQIEALVAVLERMGIPTGIDLYALLDAADLAEAQLMKEVPAIRSLSIVSGLSGVFSGFAKPVQRIAAETGVDARDIFFELGRRKVVAGQEDLILEVAQELACHQRAASGVRR